MAFIDTPVFSFVCGVFAGFVRKQFPLLKESGILEELVHHGFEDALRATETVGGELLTNKVLPQDTCELIARDIAAYIRSKTMDLPDECHVGPESIRDWVMLRRIAICAVRFVLVQNVEPEVVDEWTDNGEYFEYLTDALNAAASPSAPGSDDDEPAGEETAPDADE